MNKLGCLLLLGIIAVLCIEIWLMLLLWQKTDEPFGILIGMGASMLLGYWLLQWRKKGLMAAMMSGNPGKFLAGMAGAVLIMVPLPLTTALGLLMQLPPVQALFSGLMTTIMASVMRNAAKRMFQGGGGFPGGLGGMGGLGGIPPGMKPKPGKPDSAKEYDVKAERVDKDQ